MLNLDSLEKSIGALRRSISAFSHAEKSGLDHDIQESIRAGVIQNFKVAYEQSWKMIKRWIQENISTTEADGITRRELFRIAIENSLIDDLDTWMDFHDSRNETSHTYDSKTAHNVFKTAHRFLGEATKLLASLHARND
jgi:nucleotidyltransferase substrate binding protein (TIGR01987 family)